MDDPERPPLDALRRGLAGALITAQIALDLLAGYVAVFVGASSEHQTAALVLLLALGITFVVVLAVSTALSARDQRSGRRSPVNWAMTGLLASAGAAFVFFAAISIVGVDQGGVAASVILAR